VRILKGRDDIPRFLLGADLLIHPAYNENTGTVLLEAVVAGLPVLTTAACGYAHYIEEAGAGRVVPLPFDQAGFDAHPRRHAGRRRRARQWAASGLAFAEQADIYSLPERAADYHPRAMNAPDILFLDEPFRTLWAGQDPFAAADALQGKVLRELEGRRTLRTEVAGRGYYVKLHRGVGWGEIFKNLRHGAPARARRRARVARHQRLTELGVDTMKAVAFGRRGSNPARLAVLHRHRGTRAHHQPRGLLPRLAAAAAGAGAEARADRAWRTWRGACTRRRQPPRLLHLPLPAAHSIPPPTPARCACR
jgi:hypothetical protein